MSMRLTPITESNMDALSNRHANNMGQMSVLGNRFDGHNRIQFCKIKELIAVTMALFAGDFGNNWVLLEGKARRKGKKNCPKYTTISTKKSFTLQHGQSSWALGPVPG